MRFARKRARTPPTPSPLISVLFVAVIALLLLPAVLSADASTTYSVDKKKHKKHHSSKSSTSTTAHTTATTTSTPTSTAHSSSAPSPTTILPNPIDDACDPLPLSLPPHQLCDHILSNCPPSGRLNYLHFYYCSSLPDDNGGDDGHGKLTPTLTFTRVVTMATLLLWIAFLFSCLGLVASDFFCPNLSTLASRLGMNESTAGVTFLALGNGSPDLFSTFSALSSGSGALAIGELIGAASFIVSVVAGSMMLIKPFKVRPHPFLRDVGFFTVAVAMTMFCLLDGKLTLAESFLMVALYLLYAATVIVGSWWQERRRRQKLLWQSSRAAYANHNSSSNNTSRASFHDQDEDRDDVHQTRPPSLLVTDELDPSPTHLESGRQLVLPNHQLSSPARSPEYAPRTQDFDLDAQADPFEVWATQQSLGSSQTPQQRPSLLTEQSRSSSSSTLSHPNSTSAYSPARPTSSQRSAITMNQLKRTHSHSRSGTRSAFRIADATSADETTIHHHMPRHSLLGAIEFRDVVRSLERGGTAVVVRPSLQRAGTTASRTGVVAAKSIPDSGRSRSRGASLSRPHNPSQPSSAREEAITGAALSRDPSMFLPHDHAPHHHHHHHQRSQASLSASQSADGLTASNADPIFEPLPSPAIVPVDDPWREHRQGDGCEPGNGSGFSQTFPRLTKLQVPSTRGHSPVPSITISAAVEDEQNERRADGLETDALTSPARHNQSQRHRQSIWHSLRRALFPSFRHWKSKSHLGRFLSIINAPPLMLLNLTLPVVDDEAEARAATSAGHQGGDTDEGQVRLEGHESPLLARSGDDRDGGLASASSETILDLSTGERTVKDEVEDTQRNRRRDLEVAAALRRLPEEASPLAGSRPQSADADDDGNNDHDDLDNRSNCSSSASSDASSVASHMPSRDTKLFLTLAQCLLSPPFCVWASTDMTPLIAACSFGCSITLTVVVLVLSLRARQKSAQSCTPSWYASPSTLAIFALSRCFMGFVVSIAWISTIVNEVVAILQALGLICGLSDAILGLTIFAAGNSLADLVADVTIARAGYPVMAISACFAGPLLNLLLGIGLSGSYLMSTKSVPGHRHTKHHKAKHPNTYPIHLSPTLISSGAGLLFVLVCTLIVVPLNGFRLDKRTGWALIAAYVVVMTVNLTVEIISGRERGHESLL